MMDEQAALAEQKEQCVFCRIVRGDIPAKKVFEDEKVLAILDIHPARKGHVLVLPKEHYPILPLIPFPEMQHLFKRVHGVAGALRESLLCKGTTVFIANGGAAGQQSPHFILHVIPREKDDFFTGTALPADADHAANDALQAQLRPRFGAMMEAYLSETGRQSLSRAPAPQPPVAAAPANAPSQEQAPAPQPSSEDRLDRLIALIDHNDDLKDALLYRVEEVKEAARTKEKWRELFAGVDIDKLSENLRVMAAAQMKRASEEQGGEGE